MVISSMVQCGSEWWRTSTINRPGRGFASPSRQAGASLGEIVHDFKEEFREKQVDYAGISGIGKSWADRH